MEQNPDIDKRITVGVKIPLDVDVSDYAIEEFLKLTQAQITFSTNAYEFTKDNPLSCKWYDEVEKKLFLHFERPVLTSEVRKYFEEEELIFKIFTPKTCISQ